MDSSFLVTLTYEVLTPHAYTHCIDVTYTLHYNEIWRIPFGRTLWESDGDGLIRRCRPGSGVWVTRGEGNLAGCSTDDNVFLPVQHSCSPLLPCQSPFTPPAPSAFPVRTPTIFLCPLSPSHPRRTLRLPGPLTQTVKRTLTISNNNVQPVAFKVKTTAPKVRLRFYVFRVRFEGSYRPRILLVVLRTTEFRPSGAWSERRGSRLVVCLLCWSAPCILLELLVVWRGV